MPSGGAGTDSGLSTMTPVPASLGPPTTLAAATGGAGNGVGGAMTHTVCTVLPSDRVVTLGLGFGGVLGAGVGGGWVTVAAVWPLGQETGVGGVVSVGSAVAAGARAMTSSPATKAAAQPRSRLRMGRAVDMSRGGYVIVLRGQRVTLPNGPQRQHL